MTDKNTASERIEVVRKLLKEDLNEALKASKDELKGLGGRYTKYLYPYLEIAAIAAKQFVANPAEFDLFRKIPGAAGGRKYKHKVDPKSYGSVLQLVLEFMFETDALTERRIVHRYARALLALDAVGTPPNAIAKAIRNEGGILKLAEKQAQQNSAAKKSVQAKKAPSLVLSFAGKRFPITSKELKDGLEKTGEGEIRVRYGRKDQGGFQVIGEPSIISPKVRLKTDSQHGPSRSHPFAPRSNQGPFKQNRLFGA